MDPIKEEAFCHALQIMTHLNSMAPLQSGMCNSRFTRSFTIFVRSEGMMAHLKYNCSFLSLCTFTFELQTYTFIITNIAVQWESHSVPAFSVALCRVFG